MPQKPFVPIIAFLITKWILEPWGPRADLSDLQHGPESIHFLIDSLIGKWILEPWVPRTVFSDF